MKQKIKYAASLGLTGKEQFTIKGIETLTPGKLLDVVAAAPADVAPLCERNPERSQKAATSKTFKDKARVDSLVEVDYYRNGGIPWPLRSVFAKGAPLRRPRRDEVG